MPSSVQRLTQFILRIFFWMFAAVAAVGLVAVALVVLALSLLRALITGRRPSQSMVFGRFQRFSPGMWHPNGRGDVGAPFRRPDVASAGHAQSQVVDVEVREIPDSKKHS